MTIGWKRGFKILVLVVTFLGKKGLAGEVAATERQKWMTDVLMCAGRNIERFDGAGHAVEAENGYKICKL